MTYVLNIIVCSIVLGTCSAPIPQGQFSSYQECGHAGYEYAYNTFKSYHVEDVNKFQTLIKFYCQPIEVIQS
tara:strand:- start:882 stop:1097 length:216 start_codon:yes stop_codon:yes gene_type:complete